MQVQRIQNNNYNTSFNARLKLEGHADDIHEVLGKTVKIWEERAKSIGTDKDLITIKFDKPRTYKGHNSEMGENYDWEDSSRNIFASAKINGKTLRDNKYIGYYVTNRPHSFSYIIENVAKFFDGLGCKNL